MGETRPEMSTPRALFSPDKGWASGAEVKMPSEWRSYETIQGEMETAVDSKNIQEQTKLRVERARLVNYAKDIGLFDTIKHKIEGIQNNNSFSEAMNKINRLDIKQAEIEAQGLNGWDVKLTGLLEDYKRGAWVNMALVKVEAGGRIPGISNQLLEEQKQILIWGQPPANLLNLARKELNPPKPDRSEKVIKALGEATEAMKKAAQAQERMARGEYTLDLSSLKTPEEQRFFVRELLDGIENSNRDTHDGANMYLVRGLETAYDQMFPEVAREVKARLCVHDCAELIKQANGWIFRDTDKVGPGYSIGSAAAEALRRDHELDREIVETFLRYGNEDDRHRHLFLPGLDVPKAWDIFQEVNMEYEEWAQKAGFTLNGSEKKGVFGFYKDSNPVRKNAVRKLMLDKLGGDAKAKKSLQLAEKLATATLENAVFNRGDTAGNDQLAEIIGLKEWRAKRRQAGRIRGPRIHEEDIDGFGNSWLRLARKEDGEDNPNLPLFAKDIDISKVEKNWQFHCSVVVTRYKQLCELMLDRKPKITEYDLTFLETAVVYFNTADKPQEIEIEIEKDDVIEKIKVKDGPKMLRAFWVAGVVDMLLADKDIDIGHKSYGEALGDFVHALTEEKLSEEADVFLAPEQWEYLRVNMDVDKRLAKRAAERAVKGFMKKATGLG